MKKLLSLIMVFTLLTLTLTACNGNSENGDSSTLSGQIAVITREDGSGTRGAFVELFDVRVETADGRKVDDIRPDANVQSSTGQVLAAVSGNRQAISYISLGSLDNTVRALKINGVEPTAENIINGTYEVSRPFNIVISDSGVNEAAQEFINFIMSDDGQAVISGEKYISEGGNGAYVIGSASGTVRVEGSSSISPVMTKLKEAFEAINGNVKIEIQTNDSGTGVTRTVDGSADIGMVSRNVRDTEIEQGLEVLTICLDGIAIIVNRDNPLDDATVEQIRAIFQDGGNITRWQDI
jgi:phosphate transport system substrate-binding protein